MHTQTTKMTGLAGIAMLGVLTITLSAQEFRIGIGGPVAAGTSGVKKVKAYMAVRVEGCDDPGSARITAKAEGLVNGARRNILVTLLPVNTPGVYAVEQTWPNEGVWVLNFTGSYRDRTAGALVPFDPAGFQREKAQFFPRFATRDEVDAVLKQMAAARRN